MAELGNPYHQPLLVFLFVLARIGGLILLAPVFGPRPAPQTVKAILAIAIALLVAPLHLADTAPVAGHALQLAAAVGRELSLGLIMGLAIYALSGGLQLAGQLLGQMSGLSLAEVFDPDLGGEAPLLGRLFELVAIAVFLLIGGHRQVLAAVLDTFAWMPPGQAGLIHGLFDTFVQILTQSFVLGIRAAAPVLVALLLATLILGLISRAWPQWNTLTVGLSLNALVLLAMLSISLGGAAWLFREHTDTAVEALRTSLAAIRPAAPVHE